MSAFAEHLIKIKSRNECSSCYLSSAADEYIKREIVMQAVPNINKVRLLLRSYRMKYPNNIPAHAHYRLAEIHCHGLGVDKDEGKEKYHLEVAAIGGHPDARYSLAMIEAEKCNLERALKHWIIAARQGDDESLKALMNAFKERCLSKEDLAAALRAQKAAVDATKSPQRKEAEEFFGGKV
jgi:TPR repeat protein